MKILLPFLAVMIAACSAEPKDRLATGAYGGNHVSMIVELQRTQFLFDCASGVVEGSIRLNHQDEFNVTGTFVNGGNAQNVDHTPQPARYQGSASGAIVTFSLFMPPTAATPVNIYTATRGATAQIAAC
jgi:hypothetical protein